MTLFHKFEKCKCGFAGNKTHRIGRIDKYELTVKLDPYWAGFTVADSHGTRHSPLKLLKILGRSSITSRSAKCSSINIKVAYVAARSPYGPSDRLITL